MYLDLYGILKAQRIPDLNKPASRGAARVEKCRSSVPSLSKLRWYSSALSDLILLKLTMYVFSFLHWLLIRAFASLTTGSKLSFRGDISDIRRTRNRFKIRSRIFSIQQTITGGFTGMKL